MAKSLVIVESPAKARTLNKFLGKNFTVMASVGHVKDLPKSELGVDIENDFRPNYVKIKGKGKTLADLKKAGKKADKVYLAPDPDREGEAIAWHIAEEINGKKGSIFRVLFNEITEKAVKEAIENPTELDRNKFEAQQARRILDRLVGYQVSPILWDKIRRGLSAGRVQSVAVRLICEREEEIKAFKPREYWSIIADFEKFEAKLAKRDNKKIDVKNEDEAQSILKELKGAGFEITAITRKERKKNPLPPFITSKLQQEAARKLSYSAKKTMMLAQRLYEGIEMGDEGPVGLITYMRTDSPRVSNEALASVRGFIEKKYGADYLPAKPNFYKSRKGAQEAHEAIRPTYLKYTPEVVKPLLQRDQWRLYQLIWNRFVASQMRPALLDQTAVGITAGRYLFQANGSVVKFPGFTAVYEEGRDDETEEGEKKLPVLGEGQALKPKEITPGQHFTQPPPKFSEATLVKQLEENGIGRPSTYASILSTIQDREYVVKEKNRLSPTELGFLVTNMLVEGFPKILDVEFTAHLEEELDSIEEGKTAWLDLMKEFYGPFKESLDKAKTSIKGVKGEEVPTDITCDKCGKLMVIKWGRRGKFLACPGYPECKNTKDFKADESGKVEVVERVEEIRGDCSKCGGAMVVKTGRYGRFLACSNYPDCKSTQPLSTGVPCPEEGCGGTLNEKQSKRGRLFYGCSNYPKCKYATWENPEKAKTD
ncbi:MAG: type I DNA topoisomerase [Thermodesulfobacteriota bacterium]